MKVIKYIPIKSPSGDMRENCIRLAVGYESNPADRGYFLYAMPLIHKDGNTESFMDEFTRSGCENRKKLLLAHGNGKCQDRHLEEAAKLARMYQDEIVSTVAELGEYQLLAGVKGV